MSRMFTDADLDAVLGPADSAQTFTDEDLDAALGGGLSVATQSPGIAAPMTPHDYGESWSPDQPQVQPRLDAGSMMNPMNYVAGVPDAAKGLARGFGQTVGGVAQAAPEAAAWLGEGVGGTLYVTKKKIAGFLRSIGQERDAALMDHLADLDYQNTQGAVGAVRKAGQGMSRWGQEVALGARMDPSLQYSPQAQQGVDSMQQGKTWLPTTAQGLMAMGGESGVPTLAALGGGAVAGPAGAMAAGGVAALGTTYDQSLQQLLNDPRWATRPVQEVKAEAARRAIQSGIVEGGTGAIPVEEALAGPLSKRFLTQGAGRVASGAVRGAAGMGEEALQGGAAEALGAVGDRAQGDPNAFRNLPQRVLQQAVAEGVMGLGPGAVGGFVSPGGVHAVRDAQRSTPTPDAQRGDAAPGGVDQPRTDAAVGRVDVGVPGEAARAAGGEPPVDALTNPAATEAEVLAALEALEASSGTDQASPGQPQVPAAEPTTSVAPPVPPAKVGPDQAEDSRVDGFGERSAPEPATQPQAGTPSRSADLPRSLDTSPNPTTELQSSMRLLSDLAVATGRSPERAFTGEEPVSVKDAALSESPGVTGVDSTPTTRAGWAAEARRLGVSDKGTVGLIRKRVREARASLAESTTQLPGAPTDSGPSGLPAQPAASSESLPSVQEVGRSPSPTVSVPPAGREAGASKPDRSLFPENLRLRRVSNAARIVTAEASDSTLQRSRDILNAYQRAKRNATLPQNEFYKMIADASGASGLTPKDMWLDATVRDGLERIDAEIAKRAPALAAKVTAPTTPAATESAAAAQPPRKKGGRKAAGTASTDIPRPASPGVERGSTSGDSTAKVEPAKPLKSYEKDEAQYVADRMEQYRKSYLRGIAEKQAEIDARPKWVKESRAKIKGDATLHAWKTQLAQLEATKEGNDPGGFLQKFKDEYAEVVKTAISTGKEVPANIIESRPDFIKARTARERYDKGRHTSFANKSAAVHSEMQAERGYKVKQQDGTSIRDDHKAEIARGVAEVESAIGPLADLFRKSDLTIAHTNGKFPFMRGDAGGLYHPSDKTVTVGTEVGPFRFKVRAMAHEFGHWLDYEAGSAKGKTTRLSTKSGKFYSAPSMSEAASRGTDDAGEGALIREATNTINDRMEVRRLLRPADPDKITPEQKEEKDVARFRLTPYWTAPREVWARLVEQYVANKVGKQGDAADSPQAYAKMPGWWTQEQFDKMKPDIERVIQAKLGFFRGETKAETKTTTPKPIASDPRRRGAVAFPAGDDATKRADTIATMERRAAKKAAAALESEQSAHDKTRAHKEDFRERAKGDIALLKGLIRAEASRVKGMTEARDRALSALAREAVRADNTETALREKIGGLQEDAAFKDALSKERSKAQTILLRAMADILPRSEWGIYTRRVADVKTASQAYKLAEDMQRQAVILDAKDLAKRVERVTGIKDIRDLADPKARQRAVDRGRLRILSGNEGEKDLARKALYDFAEMGTKFDELMDKAGSAQEMQDVVNALEATYQQLAGAMHQRRMENKLVGKNGMQAAQGSRDILESAIRGRTALPTDKTTKPETSAFGVLARSQLDAENTLLLMDDDAMTKAGEASRHFEEIRQARSAAAKRAEGRMLELDAIAKDAGFDGWGDARARISGSLGEASQMTVTLGKPIGGRSELTMDEALYLYGLDPQTQERAIIKGRPLSWDGNRTKKWVLGWQEYDALRRAIPEQYRTMFDRMKLVTEKNKPEMMETLRLINGFEPPSVAGYLRTWANPEFYKKADETPAGYNADTVTYLEHMGLTKEREPSAGVPLLVKGGLDAIESSITDSSRIIELAIPLRNARAVLLSQQVRAATAEHIGEDVNKSVEQLLVAAAGNRKAPDGMADRLMRKAVSNVARGKTQVNPRSWLKNTGGVLKALGEAPPSVVLEGLAKLPRSILKNPGEFSSAATQEMMDHSPYLSERYTGSPVTVLTGIQQTGVKYGKWSTVQAAGRSISAGHVGDVLFKQVPALLDHIRLSLWFDAVTASILWRGYKAKAEREGLGMEWVASQTERVMRRTQNSADPLDVSSFALDHRDRAAWAAVLSFTSDSNRSYNMLYRARRQGWKSMLRAGAAVAANQAWSSAVTGGLSAAGIAWLIGAIKGDDEEKQYERRQKAFDAASRSFWTETAGMTIFGDDIADMVWGALNPDSQTGGAVTPVGGTIDMLRSGIQRTARASMQLRNPVDRRAKEEAYDRMMNAALDVAKSGSSLLGLPFEPGIGMGEAVYGATHDKPADVIREQKEKTKGKPASDRDITDARRRLYDGMATGDEAQITGAFSALKANGVRLSRDDIEGLVKARDPYAGLKARERRELRQRLDKDPAAKAEFDRRVTEYRAAVKAVQNALRAQRRG